MADRKPDAHPAGGPANAPAQAAQDSDALIQRTVLFAGHVQGVGFRFTTMNVAGGFAVKGYVRNRSDGRVELVAEGAASEIERFEQAILDAMGGYVQSLEQSDGPATGEFADFGVRR